MNSKAPRELNDLWALPVYPIFKDEKSNGPDDPLHKKGSRSNIIATNFV